jgi:hypothetical protein
MPIVIEPPWADPGPVSVAEIEVSGRLGPTSQGTVISGNLNEQSEDSEQLRSSVGYRGRGSPTLISTLPPALSSIDNLDSPRSQSTQEFNECKHRQCTS